MQLGYLTYSGLLQDMVSETKLKTPDKSNIQGLEDKENTKL